MENFRIERDSIGEKQVPIDAYYGVQSLRAYENFKISGKTVHPELVRAIVEVKKAASLTNGKVGAIDEKIANAMTTACDEILSGNFTDAFIVDAIQGGAGTSLNMNANEVVANRAIEILGGKKGDYSIVHPNDHANCGQSTNDVFPTAGKIAIIRMLSRAIESLGKLRESFVNKSIEYKNAVKIGRTEMQDAVPTTFGKTFGAYASALSRDERRFKQAIEELSTVNMGATAIGTCVTADERYVKEIVLTLGTVTNLALKQANDLVDCTQNLDCFVFVSGILKSCATTLSKIANDLRLLSSGPRAGFNEINLPAKQNGSSIMPGKVNPVIPEVVNQIAFNVVGNDTTIAMAAEAGQLELNAFEPIIFYKLFESLETLTNGMDALRMDCVDGITVNVEKCRENVESCTSIVTALCPYIGYAKAAAIAKRALKENKSVREITLEETDFSKEKLDELLAPQKMILS